MAGQTSRWIRGGKLLYLPTLALIFKLKGSMLLCIYHLYYFPDVDQLPGHLPVAGARRGVAGGVIVDEYQGGGVIFKRPLDDFTR